MTNVCLFPAGASDSPVGADLLDTVFVRDPLVGGFFSSAPAPAMAS